MVDIHLVAEIDFRRPMARKVDLGSKRSFQTSPNFLQGGCQITQRAISSIREMFWNHIDNLEGGGVPGQEESAGRR